MRPDDGPGPVATDSRDLPADSKDDASEHPTLPSAPSAPAFNIKSSEDVTVMDASDSGELQKQADLNETTDSNHASDTQVTSEPSKPLEDAQPDQTATPVTGVDNHKTSQGVVEAAAKEDGKVLFNEPEQNGDEEGFFSQLAAGKPPGNLDVQEQSQVSEGFDRPVDNTSGQYVFAANGELGDAAGGPWDNVAGGSADGDEDFFDQLKTQTKPIYSPPDPDARFEEGMPLLSPEMPAEPPAPAKAETQIDKIFEGDEEEEEDEFFSQVQNTGPKPPFPSHITRKSTSEVMGSVGETLDSPVSESPSVQQFNEILATAPAPDNHVNKVSSDEDLAARWQAELSDNEEAQEPAADDLAARWQAELDDDDDDLLMDEASADTAGQEQSFGNVNAPPAGPYGPQSSSASRMPSSTYTPHQPSTSDLVQGLPMQGAQANPAPTPSYFAPQAPPRPDMIRAESFAERSKEGYKSPYDVPEGLARPRRPAKPVITAAPMPSSNNVSHSSNVPTAGGMPPPPPRSNSIPAPPPAAGPQPVAAPMPPPTTGPSPQIGPPPPAPKNFYEELPLPPPRPRSRPTSSGKYTPNPNTATPPQAPISQAVPPPPSVNPYANITQSSQPPSEPQAPAQLQPPERLDPYINSLAPAPPAAPSASSRYSPKPPGLQATKPPSSPRYSPAPPPSTGPRNNRYAAQPPGAPTSLPFQPRTSSPLVHHEKVSYQPEQPERRTSLEPAASLSPPSRFEPRPSFEQSPPQISGPGEDGVSQAIKNAEPPGDVPPPANQQTSPPRNIYAPPAYVNGFADRMAPVNNAPASFPVIETPDVGESQFVPPRRSQTQSPGQQLLSPKLSVPSIDPFQRPASVHGSGSPTKATNPYAPAQVSASNRVAAQPLNFIPPSDEQQMDPLERWKGSPIISFGFGGAVTSCFPKHIPRYAAGQAAPMIKSTPGEVKICQVNDLVPLVDSIVAHPGPLKNKSKKKDVIMWLSSKIAAFENEGLPEDARFYPDSHKRHDEKILLWKIIRILVENDGVLEGSNDVQNSLRGVVFPNLQNAQAGETYGNAFAAPLNAPSQPDAIDSRSIDALRDNLVIGNREKAVWDAVDNRLWGHAMIIASTLDRSVWKQVVQEFVRREVRSATGNTESLAALYEIFAGNVEESVDELVPPSARAGLQMVSMVNGQESSKNGLDGLDSWKDTLGLVLSNRSAEDYQALMALGRLLLSYGRVEAAHICMIFSRAAIFGGADDPQASIVLLGADHQHFPSTFMHDEDAILLTEAFEFATSILAGSPQAALPHLMGFKVQYAWSLAERGRRSESQQYCDTITAALKATTRPSGYQHMHLFAAVDDLSTRLRQTTSDGGSSWISRPSLEKVSGSMWSRFNSFVAGEDSDAASSASGKGPDADVGPFANVTGTPTVSRSPSMSDLYGSYPAVGAQPIASSAPSRYHPSNQYAPNSSPEQFRGRSSMDSQRSFGFSFGRRGSQEPATPNENNYYPGGSSYTSPLVGYQSTPPQTSYMPLAPVREDLPSQPQPQPAPIQAAVSESPYQPSMYTPQTYAQPFGNQDPVNEPQSGYMPPATGGYGPPVEEYGTPFALEEETVEEEKPKKSMVDDDDDDDDGMAARSVAIQKAERERLDREAQEAFIKAAEEDGKSFQLQFQPKRLLTLLANSQKGPSTKEVLVRRLVWRIQERTRQQCGRWTDPCQTWGAEFFLL